MQRSSVRDIALLGPVKTFVKALKEDYGAFKARVLDLVCLQRDNAHFCSQKPVISLLEKGETIMRRLILTTALAILLVCAFSGSSAAASADALWPAQDFRVSVKTNKRVYFNKDVLRLSVQLLNDSPKAVHISRQAITDRDVYYDDSDSGRIFEGVLDDQVVSVEVSSLYPIIIGYVRLIPLGPSPVSTEAEEVSANTKAFRLPLFGRTMIREHSSRIISTANILIIHPELVDPTDIEPLDGDMEETEAAAVISASGRYVALRPGYYLVDCNINRIWGTKLAKAQKIIRITPRRVVPVPYPVEK
jgi:hypothetical protein